MASSERGSALLSLALFAAGLILLFAVVAHQCHAVATAAGWIEWWIGKDVLVKS